MVPPLAMALASTVSTAAVHQPERRTARRPGCSAQRSSPRAIPFAAADIFASSPPRWSAVPSPVPSRWSSASRASAPHGGVFVFFAIDNFWLLVALAAGVVVAALLLVVLKRFARRARSRFPRRAVSPVAATA
jgi:PTS system fructose-specific IIC component